MSSDWSGTFMNILILHAWFLVNLDRHQCLQGFFGINLNFKSNKLPVWFVYWLNFASISYDVLQCHFWNCRSLLSLVGVIVILWQSKKFPFLALESIKNNWIVTQVLICIHAFNNDHACYFERGLYMLFTIIVLVS